MRRNFMSNFFLIIIFLASPVCAKENNIPATEDLMREHGIINRLLLIYEKIIHKIDQKNTLAIEELSDALYIATEFIQKYHEKLEEDYIFPLFEKNKKERALISTLRKQHNKGREITAELQKFVQTKEPKNSRVNNRIKYLLQEFIGMYRPHEAREDTKLFPQVRSLLSETAFSELGRRFEDMEERFFGKNGFEKILNKIENIEKRLEIYVLDQFTPN